MKLMYRDLNRFYTLPTFCFVWTTLWTVRSELFLKDFWQTSQRTEGGENPSLCECFVFRCRRRPDKGKKDIVSSVKYPELFLCQVGSGSRITLPDTDPDLLFLTRNSAWLLKIFSSVPLCILEICQLFWLQVKGPDPDLERPERWKVGSGSTTLLLRMLTPDLFRTKNRN